MEEYKKMWKYGFTFTGRSTRQDYWMAVLFNFLASFVVGFVAGMLQFPSLGLIYSIAILVPSLAMSIRRMHDINKSGWVILLSLIPLVGGIIVLVFHCLPSVNEDNNYGEVLE